MEEVAERPDEAHQIVQQETVRPLAKAAEASNLLHALVQAARDPSTDITKMERLFAMHKEMSAIQAKQEFLDALARTQQSVEPIRRNLRNSHTSSNYASLSAIQREVTPIASANGLSLTFFTEPSRIPDCICVIGELAHRGGHTQRYPLDLPLDKAGAKGNTNKTDIQAISSSGTYAQRVLTKMIYGISEEGDDKDGNRPPQQPQEQRGSAKPDYSQEQFDAHFDEWKELIETGKKSAQAVIAKLESKATLTAAQKHQLTSLKKREAAQA